MVRGGYGINYNLSQYGTIITQLAYQPPFAVALTPIATTPGQLSFAKLSPTAPAGLTNNYGVDPNYRLAYVQLWNLNIQHEFGTSLVVNVGYNGSKGTDLDTMTAPNRTPSGLLLPIGGGVQLRDLARLFDSARGNPAGSQATGARFGGWRHVCIFQVD